LLVADIVHNTDDALDLCDVLGSYVPGAKVKIDDVSKIPRLPGKPVGVLPDRSIRYCEGDVLNTYAFG
jgi:hypothetical protein